MRYRIILILMLFLGQQVYAQIEDEVIEDELIENNTVLKNDRQKNKIKNSKRPKAVDNIFMGMNFSFSFSTLFFMERYP